MFKIKYFQEVGKAVFSVGLFEGLNWLHDCGYILSGEYQEIRGVRTSI